MSRIFHLWFANLTDRMSRFHYCSLHTAQSIFERNCILKMWHAGTRDIRRFIFVDYSTARTYRLTGRRTPKCVQYRHRCGRHIFCPQFCNDSPWSRRGSRSYHYCRADEICVRHSVGDWGTGIGNLGTLSIFYEVKLDVHDWQSRYTIHLLWSLASIYTPTGGKIYGGV